MNILKQLFSYSIGSVLVMVIGIVSVPIITRLISPEEFGEANLIISIGIIIVSVAMFGLDQAFVRFYFDTNPKILFFKCLGSSLLLSCLLSLMIIVFKDSLVIQFGFTSSQAIYSLILYINSYIVFRFNLLVLRMLQFGYRYSLVQVLQKVLDLLFLILFLYSLIKESTAFVLSASMTMLLLTIVIFFMTIGFWKGNSEKQPTLPHAKLLKYSIPIMISSLIMVLFQSIDKLLLGKYGSKMDLGIYVGLYKIIGILGLFQISFSMFWATASLKMYKENPDNKFFFTNITNAVIFFMLSVGICVVLLRDYIILILGKEYRNYVEIILILTNIPILMTISEATVQGINFKLKTKLHIYISSCVLVITTVIGIILTKQFSVLGISFAMVIGYVLFFLLRTYYGLKNFPFKVKLKELSVMLFLYNIWIALAFFVTNTIVVNVIGAFTLTCFNIMFFYREISLFIKFIKVNLIRK